MISDWALMQESAPAALVLHWYGPSTISATVAGVPVKLRQETDYPRQGRIVLHVEPGVETQFVLKLRIPYWSAATKCSVNGKAVAAQAGTYCAWIAGGSPAIASRSTWTCACAPGPASASAPGKCRSIAVRFCWRLTRVQGR